MNRTAPGLYGDLLYRNGEWVIVRSLIGSVVCEDWTADVTEHGHLMFLNIAMDPATQQIYASGKANVGSNVVIVGPEKFKTVIPCGSGNYPSQLAIVDGRVVCYVVLSFTEYGMFDLAGTKLETLPIPDHYHETSQGIRFVADDGAVYWGDQTMAGIFEGLVIREWMQRSGYTGGQGQDGGFGLSGNGVSTLYPSGNTFFPRIAVHDQELALLYVNGAMVCWDTLTLPLEVIPPAPPLPAPKVQNVTYDALFKAGVPWQSTFHCVETDFIIAKDAQDHYTIEATNINGHDKTGQVRQLTVEGPDSEPQPPEPEPMPPLGRFWLQPNIGSKDLAALADQSMSCDVFCLYIQQIITDASTPQLGPNTYPALKDAGVFALKPLAVEMGVIKDKDCHAENAIRGLPNVVQRVKDAGGEIAAFSMDEPLTANQSDCHLPLATCADIIAEYIRAVKALGSIQVGLLEAWPFVSLKDQETLLRGLKDRQALPDYWHPDINWHDAEQQRENPITFLDEAQALALELGIAFGVFVNSTVDPIATDELHYHNVMALGERLQALVPAVAQVHVAAWAHRIKNDPTHATQNVPDNLGRYGMLQTFADVRATFEPTPQPPEPEPEDDMDFVTLISAEKTLAVREIRPSAEQGSSRLILADPGVDDRDPAKPITYNPAVFSVQPPAKGQTLPKEGARGEDQDGDWERAKLNGNYAVYTIEGKRYGWPFTLVR